MNPYMAYEAVNAKISAKKRRILDEKKLEELLGCDTIEQVTEYLRNRYNFKQVVDDIGWHNLHRDDLEVILNRYAVLEIENILHYFSGPYKDFLQVFLMKYEISDLVMILRKIVKGRTLDGIEKNFTHSAGYSTLPYNRLIMSKSVAQFIECLKNTPYYNVLKTVTDVDAEKREFHIEMKLQALLYKTLANRSQRLENIDKQAVYELVGLKTDFLNVQWIYRAKKYYDILPEQILIYSLQGGKRLSFDRLKKCCYAKSHDEVRQLSNKYIRFNIFTSGDEETIERNMDNYMYSFAEDRRYRGTIGTVLSYIFRLEIIIKDLVAVTEGIRYKLPQEHLKQYLVR